MYILFIVDFLEFLQEGVTLLCPHQERRDFSQLLDAPGGRFSFALFVAIENHNFKLITIINGPQSYPMLAFLSILQDLR